MTNGALRSRFVDAPVRPLAVPLAALARGTALVRAHACALDRAPHVRVAPRVAGNWLSELNTLLHVVLDAAGRDRALRMSPRTSHTARKLRLLLAGWPGEAEDMRRIRALARTASCLRYNGGIARYPDVIGGGTMTLGWKEPGTTLRVVAIGARAVPDAAAMVEISLFYDRLAGRLAAGDRADIARPPTLLSLAAS